MSHRGRPLRHLRTLKGSLALPPGLVASARRPSSRSTTAAPVRFEGHTSSWKLRLEFWRALVARTARTPCSGSGDAKAGTETSGCNQVSSTPFSLFSVTSQSKPVVAVYFAMKTHFTCDGSAVNLHFRARATVSRCVPQNPISLALGYSLVDTHEVLRVWQASVSISQILECRGFWWNYCTCVFLICNGHAPMIVMCLSKYPKA